MGLLLAVTSIYIPRFLKKRKLEMLFTATADAFQADAPSAEALSYDEYLKLYARFTAEQAGKLLQRGDTGEIRSRLFENAFRLGRQLKDDFHIRTTKDVMRMAGIIYKIIKIDFRGEPGGGIVIPRCFFSDYYPAGVCSLISSLDEGLLAGLSGGGKLVFSQRITEGHGSCRAYLEIDGKTT